MISSGKSIYFREGPGARFYEHLRNYTILRYQFFDFTNKKD